MALTRQQVSDRLNEAVWSTYVRINASMRFRVLAENGILIPPDVAAVAMALLDDRKLVYGDLVNGLLLPHDAELTEKFNRENPRVRLPEGATALTPFKDHLNVLYASEIIRDEWVWHDMPEELYLINQPDLDPAVRQMLLDMGYGAALERYRAGLPVYKADETAISKAEEARAVLHARWGESFAPGFAGYGAFGQANPAMVWQTVRTLVGLLGTLAIGGAAIYLGLRVIDTVAYRVKYAREWDIKLRQEQNIAEANRIQATKAEALASMLKACQAGIASGATTPEQCRAIADQLAGIEPKMPEPGLKVPAYCGFADCWPWALLAFGLGAAGGSLYAKKRGWI